MFGPSLINEVLVGYNSVLFFSELNDWAGIGNANAQYGIPGGQPIAGLSNIQWGQGLTSIGAVATVEDSLPKIYQLNEKLTWLKGRHALKFGGQWLKYNTKRFYPGNNGLLGLFNYTGTFSGSPVLGLPARPGGPQGPRLQRGPLDALPESDLALRPGRLQDPPRSDPEPRNALGLHLAARGEGQPAGELQPADGRADSREGRQHRGPGALQALLQGLRAALRFRLERDRPPRPARRLRHLAVHGRHRLQPAPAAQPAVLLRVGRRATTRRPAPARSPRASPGSLRWTSSPASCARGIPTCGRSSRSSGTCSRSTS